MELVLKNNTTDRSENEKRVKVLILGSGPAGLSAALYAARANLDPVVLTGMDLGGQASLTHTIENYPGFPDGVGGQQLSDLFQKQAEKFGARVEYDTAVEALLEEHPFRIKTYNAEYFAETVIIATGAQATHLDVPGEKELTGRGVSYCATCDGWFFKEKDVIVVGGGDSALEESLFLTRYARSITVVHRRDSLRAGVILQKRASEHPKIKFVWDSVITEILGEDKVTSVNIKNVKTGNVSSLPTDGVFIFIGHVPNTKIFADALDLDDRGYIKTDSLLATNIPGVYVAGEAGDPNFRQVVTSAGMGAAAAMQAVKYIEKLEQQQPIAVK
ncbi:MAG: thioredoxin-disulfide reductase [Anaerolineales bacterium]|nr:thioredoxin-disulfide reductase [Anaerolineae bacterium]PWB50965.1 MAG: thioredoxin-disulfide reductase [Anaerolineales bacterium]